MVSFRCRGIGFPACRMRNGQRNRVGRTASLPLRCPACLCLSPPVLPVPPVPACLACLCLSLPARACPSFLNGQSRQQMVSFRCRGTGFPACRMRNGRRNRGGRLLRFRFGVSSVCIVRAATESPRRGGLPRSFTHPIRPVSGRVVTGGICFHGMCGESGCVAARGGGAGVAGKVGHSFPVCPPTFSGRGRVVTDGICSHGVWGSSGCVAARGGGGSGRQGRTQLPGTPSHFLRLPPSPVSGRGFRSRRSGGRRRLRGTAVRRVRWPKCSGDWDSGGACRPARLWQRA